MKEDLKYKILKASLDLLEEGDVSALSMREVARRAGVSHQAPYHYFADREAILAELVRDGFERLHQDETSAVDAHDDQKDKIAALTAGAGPAGDGRRPLSARPQSTSVPSRACRSRRAIRHPSSVRALCRGICLLRLSLF